MHPHEFNDSKGLGVCVEPMLPLVAPGQVQPLCGLLREEHEDGEA